jgi:hypothetical protein
VGDDRLFLGIELQLLDARVPLPSPGFGLGWETTHDSRASFCARSPREKSLGARQLRRLVLIAYER